MVDEQLTTHEIAEILNRSVNTVYRWARQGWIKVLGKKKVGQVWRKTYSLEEAKVVDQRQNRQPTAATGIPLGKPTMPTYTTPGSMERVEVYRRRAAARQELFHDSDTVIERPTWMVREFVGSNKSGRRDAR